MTGPDDLRRARGTLRHRPIVSDATHAAELRRSGLPPNRPPPVWWEPVCALVALALAGSLAALAWRVLAAVVASGQAGAP